MTRPITHVATTDISEMMDAGTERRMPLPGFASEFVDFPHYIIRITDRIWHDRQIALCLDWYTPDCVIHTTSGDIVGAQSVVDNTWATLRSFPDRRLDADNVIWSDEGDGTFYSSHLITSKMTNLGDSEFGPATARAVRIQTIADCLCKENRIFREWLVRDNLGLVQQLGFDIDAVAARQAAEDASRGFDLITFHHASREALREGRGEAVPATDAQGLAVAALTAAWTGPTDSVPATRDFRVRGDYPGSASLYGPDQIVKAMSPRRAAFRDLKIGIHHIAEIPYLGEARDVALRWAVSARHTEDGAYGPASGADIYIIGVSQMRIMRGRVREETCIWDDLALRRQIASARLRG